MDIFLVKSDWQYFEEWHFFLNHNSPKVRAEVIRNFDNKEKEYLEQEFDGLYLSSNDIKTTDLTSNLKDFDIIHLATHGFYVKDAQSAYSLSENHSYTHSGIVMAGANNCFKDCKA